MRKNDRKQNLYTSIVQEIDEAFVECPDLVKNIIKLKTNKKACFYYFEGQVDLDLVQRDFIKPIINLDFENFDNPEVIQSHLVTKAKYHSQIEEIITDLLAGCTVVVVEDLGFSISCKLTKHDKRSISEPETEKNVKGPHEGFLETIQDNIAMLRRRMRSSKLKFKTIELGGISNQTVSIAYIQDIANPKLLDILYDKIKSINVDGLIAIGQLEQVIMDTKSSPLPQYQATERPDKAMAALLEGRYVILLDGTPVTLIVPVNFFSFFQALDDYSTNWMFGSFMNTVRVFGTIIAVFLPGLYIALVSFHYQMIPMNMLVPLAESRLKVPFPPIIEALIMELTIEMLREAAIRLPTYIGASIGIVGGLIIGQAAVDAGIVSELLLIVVALTAIATFIIPSYDMGFSIRLLRFIVMIFSSFFGIIGVIICISFVIAHLVVLESLGQPYFQPIIPLKIKDLKDTIIKLPINYRKERPDIAHPIDDRRGKE